MQSFTGNILKKRISSVTDLSSYAHRDCYEQIQDYLKGKTKRVCGLYGLRRTGKTTMMYQAIRELNDYDNTLLVNCTVGDSIYQLQKEISSGDWDYIFIDEITDIEEFIQVSSWLANDLTVFGKKVFLSGTNSLGLSLAEEDALYDRIMLVHTTYISFAEYHRLLGYDYEHYLKYGGTLTDGNTFYNRDSMTHYVNDAIARNLAISILHWTNGSGPRYAQMAERELQNYICRLVEIHARQFMLSALTQKFRSRDLSSIKKMDVLGKIDTSFTSDKALLEEVKNALHIKDTTVSIPEKKDLDQLTDYLERMDVLTNVSYKREEKKYIFTQPGLRYAQVEAIVDVLKYSDALQDKPRQERNFILSEVHNCLEGKMLEDMIFIDLFREKEVYEKYRVGQYRNNVSGKEFDLCLIDEKENESVIFEVKHSKIPVKEQTKHLANEDFCQEFEERTNTKIREKAVIYQGKTGSFFGMKYLNAEEFLLHGDLFKDLLFPGKGLGMDSDAHKVKNEVDKEVGFAPSSEVGFAPSFDPSVDGGLNLFVEDPEQ